MANRGYDTYQGNNRANGAPIPFSEFVAEPEPSVTKRWDQRAISYLENVEQRCSQNKPWQNRVDRLGSLIEKKLAPLGKWNRWIDSNGHGKLIRQLAIGLAKLPLRAARNIIRLLYNLLRALAYAAVHPKKATIRFAKYFVQLAHALTQPETWVKMGGCVLGVSLGHSLIANPVSVIGIIIGSSILVGGLSVTAIKSAIEAKSGQRIKAVKAAMLTQAKQIPESLVTGFCMGLLLGGIQHAVQIQQLHDTQLTPSKAHQYAESYIKEHDLPQPSSIQLHDGNIHIQYNATAAQEIALAHPHLIHLAHHWWNTQEVTKCTFVLRPDGSYLNYSIIGGTPTSNGLYYEYTEPALRNWWLNSLQPVHYPAPSAPINKAPFAAVGSVALSVLQS